MSLHLVTKIYFRLFKLKTNYNTYSLQEILTTDFEKAIKIQSIVMTSKILLFSDMYEFSHAACVDNSVAVLAFLISAGSSLKSSAVSFPKVLE